MVAKKGTKKKVKKNIKKKPAEKKAGLNFFQAIQGFYTHKDTKFLQNASKLVNPWILNQWLSNDMNMLEMVAILDRYLGINKDIYLAFVYHLMPKRVRAPYLKYSKADKIEPDAEEIEMVRKSMEIGKSEFNKYYKRFMVMENRGK